MASADLNQDGHGDLLVGAPGYSRPGHIHVGRVYLIYGNDLGLPPIDLDLDEEAHGVLEGSQVSTTCACASCQQPQPPGVLSGWGGGGQGDGEQGESDGQSRHRVARPMGSSSTSLLSLDR